APLRVQVREAMLPFLGPPANPSSAHREGARARSALETARAQVAALVGAAPAEIVLTSGATEANNLALRGTAAGLGIVTTAIEHASVLETARAVGAPLTVVPVDGEGRVDAGRGIGALWVRRGVELAAQTTGGPQERGRRAGTESVAGAVGFGVAAELARAELAANAAAAAGLVERLWTGLRARVPGVVLNGPADGPRLPNTLNVSFPV